VTALTPGSDSCEVRQRTQQAYDMKFSALFRPKAEG